MSAKILKSFAKAVDVFLAEKGILRTDLAKRLGVSDQQVSKYLGGHHAPGLDKVEKIAEALGVSPFLLIMSKEERAAWDFYSQMAKNSYDYSKLKKDS